MSRVIEKVNNYMPIDITVEKLSLIITILNSTFLTWLFVYLKFNVEKRIRKYDYDIKDKHELNTKIHDRMVEAECFINSSQPFPESTIERINKNASRVRKYNSELADALEGISTGWNISFKGVYPSNMPYVQYMGPDLVTGETRQLFLNIIKDIKRLNDSLV